MKKYLPIGTVVMFKGCLRPVMIIGYMFLDERLGLKDYIATIYPEGYLGDEVVMCFNHDEIHMIISMGYDDDFHKLFSKKMNKVGEQNEINTY